MDECWRNIPDHFPDVELGAHVVMPNHVHGIIVITEIGMATNSSPFVGARNASPLPPRGVKPKSIGAIVGSFKSAVTRRVGREHKATGIWQRKYGACPEPCRREHVIRDPDDWNRIHRYIESNPSLWADDNENPLKS